MGEGRFGPLFRGHDASGQDVVIRTFSQPLTAGERERLLHALSALCETPLEHPSIARPIACGVQDERPYLVHTFLPGTPLNQLITDASRPPVADSLRRITNVAGALDFAAAAGVLHGALSRNDVIFDSEGAGVSGFGIAQALQLASIPGFLPRRADDVRALAAIAAELLADAADRAAPAIAAGLANDDAVRPATALEFAGLLQRALNGTAPASVPDEVVLGPTPDDAFPSEDEEVVVPPDRAAASTPRFEWEPAEKQDSLDIPLREEPPASVAAVPLSAAPLFGSFGGADDVPAAAVGAAVSSRASRRVAHPWLIAAVVALAVGVFIGFAGGFFVGARETAPLDQAARIERPAPQPEPANGRPFTDAPVDDATAPAPATTASAPTTPSTAAPRAVPSLSGRQAAPPAIAPTREPGAAVVAPRATVPRPLANARDDADRHIARPRATERPARSVEAAAPRTGPAAVQVESRPAGAQVFVDGRSVGYTPLVVGELTPGTHSFRMQMPGFRPWVTALTLGAGARERLAASLEQ